MTAGHSGPMPESDEGRFATIPIGVNPSLKRAEPTRPSVREMRHADIRRRGNAMWDKRTGMIIHHAHRSMPRHLVIGVIQQNRLGPNVT